MNAEDYIKKIKHKSLRVPREPTPEVIEPEQAACRPSILTRKNRHHDSYITNTDSYDDITLTVIDLKECQKDKKTDSDVHSDQHSYEAPQESKQSFLSKLKKVRYKNILPVVIYILVFVVFSILTYIYRDEVVEFLDSMSTWFEKIHIWGYFLVGGVIFLLSFPPMIGYAKVVSLSGVIYGFPKGFTPAYIGALLGGVACFILARKYKKGYFKKLSEASTTVQDFVKVTEKKGFWLLLMFRFAPYPYSLTNLLLGYSSIAFWLFFVATALALSKLLIHVYLGSVLVQLLRSMGTKHADAGMDDTGGKKNEGMGNEIYFMIGLGIYMVLSTIFFTWLMKREARKAKEKEKIQQDQSYDVERY